MNKKKLFYSFWLLCFLSLGSVWGMEKKVTDIKKFPDDCLCEVFDYVDETAMDEENWHFTARLVCKNWREVLGDCYFKQSNRRPLEIALPTKLFSRYGLSVFTQRLQALDAILGDQREVTLNCCGTGIVDSQLKTILAFLNFPPRR